MPYGKLITRFTTGGHDIFITCPAKSMHLEPFGLSVHAFCGTGDENIIPTCRSAGNYYFFIISRVCVYVPNPTLDIQCTFPILFCPTLAYPILPTLLHQTLQYLPYPNPSHFTVYFSHTRSSHPCVYSVSKTDPTPLLMWDKRCYIRDTVHEGKIYYIEINKIQQLQMICSLKFNFLKA